MSRIFAWPHIDGHVPPYILLFILLCAPKSAFELNFGAFWLLRVLLRAFIGLILEFSAIFVDFYERY